MTAEQPRDFAALGAPAPLAQALAERDYQNPTPVQAHVLEAADADLMVSSQTGSGKTVAFGLVIGRILLGDAATIAPGDKPRALVVAPTRELAAQVQRELTWLFAATGARLGAFTGGTDLRGDARTLRRGVDVAVGTPGRLVDLITRKTLDLSGIQVVVLDEADEMLDLGFREALETLLEAVPAERRTLLFSATLPPPIRALARRFQKDAVAIDPRAGAAPTAHEDIRHVAYLCADRERLGALVNVLRLADDERAIVFCRTRDNVAELHGALTARGFKATAISGDRAQDERTRALEALRQGRVRVLVATNVAARGLDLPDVGLVVHADLPENAEALTHRSGRTGRAGNKGVNAFIVERGARRRAERLFRDAHLKLGWTVPPDAAAVAAHDRAQLRNEVTEALAQPVAPETTAMAEELVANHDAVAAVAVLLERALRDRPAGEALTAVEVRESEAAPRRGASSGDMVLFEVNLGAKDKAEPNWILPLVCKRGAVTRRDVGAIRVTRDRTLFEISARVAREFAANAAERDPRAPNVQIGPAEGDLPSRSSGAPTGHPARRDGQRPAPGARGGYARDRGAAAPARASSAPARASSAPARASSAPSPPSLPSVPSPPSLPPPAPTPPPRVAPPAPVAASAPPAHVKAAPARPSAPPAHVKAAPARAKYPPRRDSESPARGKYPPRRDSESPARGKYPPRRDSDSPARASHAPARTSHAPARTSHAPARTNHPPARTGHAPARTSHPPARTNHPPARTGHAPARTGHAPARTSHAPARTSHAPARTSHAPARTSHAPARTGHAPARTSHAPARTGHAPARTGHPPARGSRPPERGGHPGGGGHRSPPRSGGHRPPTRRQ